MDPAGRAPKKGLDMQERIPKNRNSFRVFHPREKNSRGSAGGSGRPAKPAAFALGRRRVQGGKALPVLHPGLFCLEINLTELEYQTQKIHRFL